MPQRSARLGLSVGTRRPGSQGRSRGHRVWPPHVTKGTLRPGKGTGPAAKANARREAPSPAASRLTPADGPPFVREAALLLPLHEAHPSDRVGDPRHLVTPSGTRRGGGAGRQGQGRGGTRSCHVPGPPHRWLSSSWKETPAPGRAPPAAGSLDPHTLHPALALASAGSWVTSPSLLQNPVGKRCHFSFPAGLPPPLAWTHGVPCGGCRGFRLSSGQPRDPTPGPPPGCTRRLCPITGVGFRGPLLSPKHELLQLDLGQGCEQVRAEPLSDSMSVSPCRPAPGQTRMNDKVLLPRFPSISPASLLGSGETGGNETKVLPSRTYEWGTRTLNQPTQPKGEGESSDVTSGRK